MTEPAELRIEFYVPKCCVYLEIKLKVQMQLIDRERVSVRERIYQKGTDECKFGRSFMQSFSTQEAARK